MKPFQFAFAMLYLAAPLFLNAQLVGQPAELTRRVYKVQYEPATYLEAQTDNRLHITVPDSTVTRLLVNASQGTVRQEGADFIIHPEAAGPVVLKIYNYNDLSNPVLIEARTLEAYNPAASPVVLLGGKNKGTISRKELAAITRLEIAGQPDAEIVQFQMSVSGKEPYTSFNGSSAYLSTAMADRLKQASAGSKVYVEWIRIAEGGNIRNIAPLTLTLTD